MHTEVDNFVNKNQPWLILVYNMFIIMKSFTDIAIFSYFHKFPQKIIIKKYNKYVLKKGRKQFGKT